MFVGGESELPSTVLEGRYAINYFAEQMGGLMVALEHRYYGMSQPFADMSDMRFLSSKQAVADYTRFIPFVKRQHGAEGQKVVVLGGSYAGSLASWLRVQHPFLVDAALSASAPVLWELNFASYLAHVKAAVVELGGQPCMDRVAAALASSMRMLGEDKAQFAEVYQLAEGQLPQDLTAYDRTAIAQRLADPLVAAVQYHKAAGYDGSGHGGDVQGLCERLTDGLTDDSPELDVVRRYASVFDPLSGHGDLSFAAVAGTLGNTTAPNDHRAWWYQTCTEFASFQTADAAAEFTPENNLQTRLRLCHDLFFGSLVADETADYAKTAAIIQEAVDFTNQWYSSRNQPIGGIYYTNGRVDPWSEPAIVQGKTWADGQFIGGVAEWIDQGSHCSDMYMNWTMNDDVRARQLAKLNEWTK